jgi:hypothetical protein
MCIIESARTNIATRQLGNIGALKFENCKFEDCHFIVIAAKEINEFMCCL